MPKVFYEIGTWKLAFIRQNLAFFTPAFDVYEIDPWIVFTGGELPRDGVRHSGGALPHQPRKRTKQICQITATASGLKIHRSQVCRAYFFLQAYQGGAASVRRCRPPGLGRGNGGVRPAKSSGQFHAGNIGRQLKKKLFLMQPGQKQNGGLFRQS